MDMLLVMDMLRWLSRTTGRRQWLGRGLLSEIDAELAR
jgi:hypothetical protein